MNKQLWLPFFLISTTFCTLSTTLSALESSEDIVATSLAYTAYQTQIQATQKPLTPHSKKTKVPGAVPTVQPKTTQQTAKTKPDTKIASKPASTELTVQAQPPEVLSTQITTEPITDEKPADIIDNVKQSSYSMPSTENLSYVQPPIIRRIPTPNAYSEDLQATRDAYQQFKTKILAKKPPRPAKQVSPANTESKALPESPLAVGEMVALDLSIEELSTIDALQDICPLLIGNARIAQFKTGFSALLHDKLPNVPRPEQALKSLHDDVEYQQVLKESRDSFNQYTVSQNRSLCLDVSTYQSEL